FRVHRSYFIVYYGRLFFTKTFGRPRTYINLRARAGSFEEGGKVERKIGREKRGGLWRQFCCYNFTAGRL
ncbi:MAG TPA: hypothetical protein VJT82_08665, partial [Pyrinomonadaceae bacterium]|nr:hypothetical protein [Pyrinomonadaceae bacterium]